MFKKSDKGYYFWEEFSKINELIHGVSTRSFGSIKNSGKINEKNLKGFLDILHIDRKNIVFPKQVHGSNVAIVDELRDVTYDVDGIITKRKNIFLGIVTADCLPVIFYDKKLKMAGIAHAGYKGILRGILKNMVLSFKKLGSDTKNILVAICPYIGVCCYDVPIDRIEMFDKFLNFDGDSGQALRQAQGSEPSRTARMTSLYQTRSGKYFLDLKNIAKQILISEGISEKNIEVSNICTKDNIKDFFSFRGEGKIVGEFVTIVGRSQ